MEEQGALQNLSQTKQQFIWCKSYKKQLFKVSENFPKNTQKIEIYLFNKIYYISLKQQKQVYQVVSLHRPSQIHVIETGEYIQEDRDFHPWVTSFNPGDADHWFFSSPSTLYPVQCCKSSILEGMDKRTETFFPHHSCYSQGEISPET